MKELYKEIRKYKEENKKLNLLKDSNNQFYSETINNMKIAIDFLSRQYKSLINESNKIDIQYKNSLQLKKKKKNDLNYHLNIFQNKCNELCNNCKNKNLECEKFNNVIKENKKTICKMKIDNENLEKKIEYANNEYQFNVSKINNNIINQNNEENNFSNINKSETTKDLINYKLNEENNKLYNSSLKTIENNKNEIFYKISENNNNKELKNVSEQINSEKNNNNNFIFKPENKNDNKQKFMIFK